MLEAPTRWIHDWTVLNESFTTGFVKDVSVADQLSSRIRSHLLNLY